MILDDANSPAVEGGTYVIAYGELVDGYRHAYSAPVGRYGHRTVVRYSRRADHPPDPRCPECNPTPPIVATEGDGGSDV